MRRAGDLLWVRRDRDDRDLTVHRSATPMLVLRTDVSGALLPVQIADRDGGRPMDTGIRVDRVGKRAVAVIYGNRSTRCDRSVTLGGDGEEVGVEGPPCSSAASHRRPATLANTARYCVSA